MLRVFGGNTPSLTKSITAGALIFILAVLASSCSSREGLTDADVDDLLASDFAKSLGSGSQLGFQEADPDEMAERAKLAHANMTLTEIDQTKRYPVILQIGHYPRVPGSGQKVGTSGQLITEQEGAALVVSLVSEHLQEKGIDYAVIGADEFKKYPKLEGGNNRFLAKVFVSFHFDGAEPACVVGPSLGYNPDLGKMSMREIGLAVAIGLGLDARDFMKDNYTTNLKEFYGYDQVDATIAEGLIELSELSCSLQEDKFLRRAELVSEHIATALTFALELQGK